MFGDVPDEVPAETVCQPSGSRAPFPAVLSPRRTSLTLEGKCPNGKPLLLRSAPNNDYKPFVSCGCKEYSLLWCRVEKDPRRDQYVPPTP